MLELAQVLGLVVVLVDNIQQLQVIHLLVLIAATMQVAVAVEKDLEVGVLVGRVVVAQE